MEQLKKLMEKRMEKEPPMDENRRQAKMNALRALHSDMKGMLGDGLDGHMEGLKKVSVEAPNKENLEEGLDKAKDMLSAMPEDNEDHEDESNEMSPADMLQDKIMEGKEHEQKEEMSMEEMMKQLMELKDEVRRLKGE